MSEGPASARITAAIYDCPKIVARAISDTLRKGGHEVLYEGPLCRSTARPDADVWITKWTAVLNGAFLREAHPKRGLVTISSGKGHIDEAALGSLGLRYENCPTYGSNSVAEHAMALMFRGLYGEGVLPPLGTRHIMFSHFSDEFGERAVAQILMRVRQMNSAVARAREYDYQRLDEPWSNTELSSASIGIVGRDRSAVQLARTLHDGFGCRLYGFESSESLYFYNVQQRPLIELLDTCDYVFMCTDRYGFLVPEDARDVSLSKGIVDSRHLPDSEVPFTGSSTAVLGTGGIGSIIARIAIRGFRCSVTAYSRSERENLASEGVVYHTPHKDKDALPKTLDGAHFVFISAKLPKGSPPLISADTLGGIPAFGPRTIVNVARDDMVASGPMYRMLSDGSVYCYATDVLPNDAILWGGGKPDDVTRSFVQHSSVVATPHEGDCSRSSLERMCLELSEKLRVILDG